MVFLQNLDRHPFARKQLLLDAFFQIVDTLLVHQARAVDVYADHAPVTVRRDLLDPDHFKQSPPIFRNM